MKRKILIITAVMLVFATGFVLFNLNPRLVPQKKSYPEGTQTITAVWKGITLFEYYTGYPFKLERLEEGEWLKVADKGDVMFELPAFTLFHGKKFDYPIGIYAANIETGHYRIVTEMFHDKTREATAMYCEFEVK